MTKANLDSNDICQLLEGICQTVFSTGLERRDREVSSADRESLSACIRITGSWEGATVLRCSLTLARRLATAILGVEELTKEDIFDAFGELTNLGAGALQTLVPGPSELTPPTVIEGHDYTLFLPRCLPIVEQHFECWSEPLTLVVFESTEPDAEENLPEDAGGACN